MCKTFSKIKKRNAINQGRTKKMKKEIKYLIDQIENDIVLKQIRSFILGIMTGCKKKQNK